MLLSDPFLQLPTADSVRVVWFTEFAGRDHELVYGADLNKIATASSQKMTRLLDTRVDPPIPRAVWRHEATAAGLTPGIRVPYFVRSQTDEGRLVKSNTFSLQPLPTPGQPLKILITSDHQLMPNTHINLTKVVETAGTVDAVFLAGDLVNIPDDASEWFERGKRGIGFFPALQGRAQDIDPTVTHPGGQILQHAHLFPVIGNHEVMGRVDPKTGQAQFGADHPRWWAELTYESIAETLNPSTDPQIRETWIRDHSWNVTTYEEVFTLPQESPGGEKYYSQRYGDIFLLGLFVTRPWRMVKSIPKVPGKYQEAPETLSDPNQWGFGDFLYEPLGKESEQYTWLTTQLESTAFKTAPYRYVMTHQASRGLGENAIPLLSEPVMTLEYLDPFGAKQSQSWPLPVSREVWQQEIQPLLSSLTGVKYTYPRHRDGWHQDLEPLFEKAGVQIVHHGHSHLWYRSQTPAGLVFLESSNVGNSYGSYLPGYKERVTVAPAGDPYSSEDYPATGDPYGADPVFPSLFSPLQQGSQPLPTVDSNEHTVFTIFETETGMVSSYSVDLRDPELSVRKFDVFRLPRADNSL
jgi:predicted phosphodiesterase